MENFHHALKFNDDLCIGCSHCTSVCPTGAIHISHGKPILNNNRCIDCGKCYIVCPTNSIYIEQDDFQTIYNYKCPVILLPSIFSAQFPERISQRAILSAIYHLGFKYVYEVEKSADIIKEELINKVQDENRDKPIISSFCPAIVRLIQVKYPSLTDNLLLIKPPLDMTAHYIKKVLTEHGVPLEDIGIFYVSPCAAKIAAIKSPVGEEKSVIDGVINMNYLYNKVFRVIKQGLYQIREDEFDFHPISKGSLLWSLTGGEVNGIPMGRNLAIDEIYNVSEFLEKVENEDITDIDFLELRACDESCAGGILCAGTGKSKEVVVPKGITIIGNKAFAGQDITKVTIPEGVTTIGDRAFYECANLTEVTLPESAKFIERRAFGYCKSLMTISIPEGMLMIDDEAFLGCGELIKTDRKRY